VRREWRYKRDEEGRPRRFLSHREAFAWTVRRVGVYSGAFLLLALLGSLGRSTARNGEVPHWTAVVGVAIAAVAFWALIVGGLYLYIALAGGVMDRDDPSALPGGAGSPTGLG